MYAWVSSTLVTCLARTKVAASLRLSWVRSAGRGGRLAQPAAASASVSTAADRRNMVVSLMRATPGYPVWSVLGTRVRPQANDVETGRGYRSWAEDRIVLRNQGGSPWRARTTSSTPTVIS